MSTRHVVRAGECIEAIAFQYGHVPATLWDHPENEALRALRRSRNVLLPGDVVVVPPLRQQQVSAATGRRHTFRRRSVPSRLQLRLVEDGLPMADVPYVYEVEGEIEAEARTDADGWVIQPLAPDAVEVLLTLHPGTPRERRIAVRMGHLHPVSTERGVRHRLFNLDYLQGIDDPAEQLLLAVCLFQEDEGLEVSGVFDAATQAALVERHGS